MVPRVFPFLPRLLILGTLASVTMGCSFLNSIGEGDAPGEPASNLPQTTRSNVSDVAGMTSAAAPAGRVGVNAFLWRASLDTLNFMPIVQADPFGGVILTDWYSPPTTPEERFKVNIYILDAALRADGVRASVFRQVLEPTGWRDALVAPETSTQLEDSILTRARQLRIAANPEANR